MGRTSFSFLVGGEVKMNSFKGGGSAPQNKKRLKASTGKEKSQQRTKTRELELRSTY